MKIAIGCDHGGFLLKNEIIQMLGEEYEFVDFGCESEESVDYVEYAAKVANTVADGKCQLGILVCGTGIGMSIAANKVKGIRASVCSEIFSAEMTRRHNDANILCLGGRVVDCELGVKLAKLFLETPFEGGRHQKRIDMIKAIENQNFR